MTPRLLRIDAPPEGHGPRPVLKAAIDVAGLPTTAGCPAVGDRAAPATAGAPIVAAGRAQGARLPFNVSGHPAPALPVPVGGAALPGSLPPVGPIGGEERLLGFGAAIETALRRCAS